MAHPRSPAARRPALIQPLEPRQLHSAVLTPLAAFTDGSAYMGGHVAVDAAGDLFGVNQSADAASQTSYVWELPKTAAGYAAKVVTLATFPGDSGGFERPAQEGLVIAPDGNLFGLNSTSNVDNLGPYGVDLWEVPKVAAGGYGAPTVVGTLPYIYDAGQMTVDPAGDVFGIVEQSAAGATTQAEVFEYMAGGQLTDAADFTTTNQFTGGTGNLGLPASGLASDAAGNVYGFAPFGGNVLTSYDNGLGGTVTQATGDVFELPAGSHALRVVASVPAADADLLGGVYPQVSVAAVNGNTVVYGDNATNGWAATVAGPAASATAVDLGTFGPGGNSVDAGRAAVADAAGNAYGTTNTGIWEATANPDGSHAAPAQVATVSSDAEAGPVSYLTTDGTYVFGTTATGVFAVGPAALTVVGGGTTTPTPTPTGTSPLTVTAGRTTVPAGVVAGAKLKGSVTVAIDNAGGTALKGTDVVSLYAVTAGEALTAGTLLGTAKRGGTLAAGRSANVAVPVRPLALPAGAYTLLAVVTDPSGGTVTATAGPAVTVAPATIALTGALSASPAAIEAGKTLTLTLTLTNAGNVNSTGRATAAVYLSANGTALTLPATTAKVAPVVKPGKAATLRLKVKVPVDTIGTYFPLVVFTQGEATATTAATSAVNVTVFIGRGAR